VKSLSESAPPGALELEETGHKQAALASSGGATMICRMETAAHPLHISVEDYLTFEAGGQVRHEFIGGRVHAMAGTSERHNLIAMNVGNAFFNHLRGGPCKTYMADFKVRLEVHREDILYYPDVMVACVRDGVEKYFLRYPKLIVEILSESTQAIDRREKLLNYPTIPTLAEYVFIAQDTHEVTLHQREEQWRPVLLTRPDAPVEFRSIKLTVPLAQIYEGLL
jgi:Uma2 family endonuclease